MGSLSCEKALWINGGVWGMFIHHSAARPSISGFSDAIADITLYSFRGWVDH